MNYITEYRSKKYYVGSVHATNDHGPLKVLGRLDDPKCDLYAVEFLSTGFKTKARTSGIVKGMVKDYHVPVVFNRGFLGTGKHTTKKNGKTTREYKAWTGMFYRCYSSDPQHKNYVRRGITVDQRWHNFQIFCDDIEKLEGYEAWKNGFNMALDKDIKFNGTYSNTSCMFITKAENTKEANNRRHSSKN